MLHGAEIRVELLGGARGRRAFRGQPWSSSASFAVVRAFSAELLVLSLSPPSDGGRWHSDGTQMVADGTQMGPDQMVAVAVGRQWDKHGHMGT